MVHDCAPLSSSRASSWQDATHWREKAGRSCANRGIGYDREQSGQTSEDDIWCREAFSARAMFIRARCPLMGSFLVGSWAVAAMFAFRLWSVPSPLTFQHEFEGRTSNRSGRYHFRKPLFSGNKSKIQWLCRTGIKRWDQWCALEWV